MQDAVELSSLVASLEEISTRVAALVEKSEGSDGVDAELVALERSLATSLRRLKRAARNADKRQATSR